MIEYFFKTLERPTADQSREMADYIYFLERFLNDIFDEHELILSSEGLKSFGIGLYHEKFKEIIGEFDK